MTREEAITIGFGLMRACPVYRDYNDADIQLAAACSADCAAALGILKLDEPMSAESRAFDLFCAEKLPVNHILNALDRAGLKIVEK